MQLFLKLAFVAVFMVMVAVNARAAFAMDVLDSVQLT